MKGRTAIYPFDGPPPPAHVRRLLTERLYCPNGVTVVRGLARRCLYPRVTWSRQGRRWVRRLKYRPVNQHVEWWRAPDTKHIWPKRGYASKRRHNWAGGSPGNPRHRDAHGNDMWTNGDKHRSWAMVKHRSSLPYAVDLDRMVHVMTKGRGPGRLRPRR